MVDLRLHVERHCLGCVLFDKTEKLSTKRPGGTVVMRSPANAGDSRDMASIPGSGRSRGGGNDNPLQYSCLETWTQVSDELQFIVL